MTVESESLAAYTWLEEGYQPLVFSHDWQVALLNWEPLFDLANVGEVERHLETDEVFILLRGQAALFVITDSGLRVQDMEPGAVYNVRQGVWHNLLSTRDATWVIVENRDTHLHDCEFRQLSAAERGVFLANLPAWLS